MIEIFKIHPDGATSALSPSTLNNNAFTEIVSFIATFFGGNVTYFGRNLDIVESQYDMLSGETVFKVRGSNNGIDITTIWFLKDDRIHNWEYHTNPFDYPLYFPIFNKMAESIQFTNSTA